MEKAKKFLPIDTLVAQYLRDAIEEAGLTYRQIADQTGMSINRIGIILRQERPPATVGEIGMIAGTIGLTASQLVDRAAAALKESNVIHGRFGRPEPQGPDAGLDLDYDPDLDAVAHEDTGEPTDEQ